VKLQLPIPPSVNQLYPSSKSGRRFKSKRYKEWEIEANQWLIADFIPDVDRFNDKQRLYVTYKYAFKDRRIRDIANFEKAVSDFLQKEKIIEDDSQIDIMHLIRLPIDKENPRVDITIKEI